VGGFGRGSVVLTFEDDGLGAGSWLGTTFGGSRRVAVVLVSLAWMGVEGGVNVRGCLRTGRRRPRICERPRGRQEWWLWLTANTV
jgi:hypothetical protein